MALSMCLFMVSWAGGCQNQSELAALAATIDEESTNPSSSSEEADAGDDQARVAAEDQAFVADELASGEADGEVVEPSTAAEEEADRTADSAGDDNSSSPVTSDCEAELRGADSAMYDALGTSVSISGAVAVAGAPKDDTSAGSNVGSAYVFSDDGSGWAQEQKLVASDGAAYDEFGTAVAIDGDTAVVGSPFDDDRGTSSGSAYVFRFNGSSWTQTQKLLAADGAASDQFGSAVAIDGDTMVVGAHNDGNVAPAAGHGAAYIYRFNGSAWVQEQKLLASDFASGDQFGRSVALSGNVAVVGAQLDRDFGSSSGSAYVFRRSGSTWVQERKLLPSDGAAYQNFGCSVAVAGGLAVIGAFRDDSQGLDFGSAYVFRYNGSTWIQETELHGSDTAQNDKFGWSVAAGVDVAVVGASNAENSYYTYNDGAGAVYVFRKTGSLWLEEEKLIATDGALNDFLGTAVSLSGDVIIAGAPGHGHSTFAAGATYVVSSCEAGVIIPTASVVAAVSRTTNPRAPGICDSNLIPARKSEPHQSGISQIRIDFDMPPGTPSGPGVIIDQATCAAPVFVPYVGGAVVTSTVAGNGLVLTFSPALENARAYRITIGPEVTLIPGQMIEVRGLIGDVDSDGRVNATDRSLVVGAWTSTGFTCPTDLTSDGATNSVDRSIVTAAWTSGENCAP